ncbi:MAG: STAS domain-containing protein [Clostridia bacterium]
MKIDFKKEKENIVIYLSGELGNFEAKEIMHEAEAILAIYKHEDVVLDLSQLTFMDSSGIAVIMKIFKNTKDSRDFTVRNTPSMAMKVFSTTGILKFVKFA